MSYPMFGMTGTVSERRYRLNELYLKALSLALKSTHNSVRANHFLAKRDKLKFLSQSDNITETEYSWVKNECDRRYNRVCKCSTYSGQYVFCSESCYKN